MTHIDRTLYEISDELLQFHDMLESPEMQNVLEQSDGEIPADVAEKLDALDLQFEAKVENCGAYCAYLEDQLQLYMGWIATRQTRVLQMRKRLAWLREYVLDRMKAVGKTKIEGALGNYGVRLNPPRVVIDDPDAIPEVYLIPQDPRIARAEIRNKLKAGVFVPGAKLERGETFYYPRRRGSIQFGDD